MSTVDDYIKQNAELHQFAAEVARIISGIPSMPEFSAERLTVDDVSKMTGIPVASVRAGIVYGWLPIGTATRNNKVVKSLTGELRICLSVHDWNKFVKQPFFQELIEYLDKIQIQGNIDSLGLDKEKLGIL